MYSRVKIFGHSLHPMLIVFPVAFYTASFASFIAYQTSSNVFWFRVGYVANVAGVIMAVAAAIPGFLDWAMGIPGNHPAKRTGLVHMVLNLTALIVFAVNAWVVSSKYDDVTPDGGTAVLLTGLGFAMTLGAGYFGWTLVQTHKVGVDLNPGQEKLENTSPRGNVFGGTPHEQPI